MSALQRVFRMIFHLEFEVVVIHRLRHLLSINALMLPGCFFCSVYSGVVCKQVKKVSTT